jgi:hypothetical protein
VRQRRGRHDPGRVVRDLAVMLADGGDCLADLRAVADQTPLFGEVASTSTAFGSSTRSRATRAVLSACGPRTLARGRVRGSSPGRGSD